MRYLSLVELDYPNSALVKVGNAPDWGRKVHTFALSIDHEITLASTSRTLLDTLAPLIDWHTLLGSKNTWQVIMDGQVQYIP